MGAAKANNSKDTYLATAVTFMVIGAFFCNRLAVGDE